jgi:hypothetical protein
MTARGRSLAEGDAMNNEARNPKQGGQHSGRGGHGWWAMVAGCVPTIVIFALIALKVI